MNIIFIIAADFPELFQNGSKGESVKHGGSIKTSEMPCVEQAMKDKQG